MRTCSRGALRIGLRLGIGVGVGVGEWCLPLLGFCGFVFEGFGFAEIGVLAFKCILYLFIEWSCGEDKEDDMVLKIGIVKKKIEGNFKYLFSVFK